MAPIAKQRVIKPNVDLLENIYSTIPLPTPKPTNMDFVASMVWDVKPANEITLSNPSLVVISDDYIDIDLTIAKVLTDLIEISASTVFLRISISGGDARVTYCNTLPVKGGVGEPWFKGGVIPVNKSIAECIKIIQDSSTALKLYIVQYGFE